MSLTRRFTWLTFAVIVYAGLFALSKGDLNAETTPTAPSDAVTITLRDGTTYRGVVLSEDAETIVLRVGRGVRIRIARAEIASRERVSAPARRGTVERSYPNDSRLLVSPTGRPLRKGQAYLTDVYVLLPGVAYGVTDNVSILAGMSVIPGVAPDKQMFYLAPRLGARFSDRVAVSVGVLSAFVASEGNGGIGFVAGTFGPPSRSVTVGVGLSYSVFENRKEVGKPIVMFGGSLRLSDSVSLVSENWLPFGYDASPAHWPFGIAARFTGKSLSFDLGVILVGEVLKEGFPLPWLSAAYHFGRA